MIDRTSPRLVKFSEVFTKVNRAHAAADAVTVVVSLFNYASFVEDCLHSIEAQLHPRIELVVVDDASLDGSVAAVQGWMEQHQSRFDRVSLIRHFRNQGLAEARNTAFENARTDLVFVIDADNEIYPRTLGRLYEVMKDADFDAAYTQLEFFGTQTGIGYADVWSKQRFLNGNYVDAMAMVSKEAWRTVRGYTHLEGGWEDYDFWCKFIDCGMTAAYVPELLCRYRVHGASMLRTETGPATERLKVEMTTRHPWIKM